MEITLLSLDKILPPPKSDAARLVGIDSLAANIKATRDAIPGSTGILQALIVKLYKGKDSSRSQYEIIAGRRRYTAAAKLKLPEVPVVIVDVDDATAQGVTVAENFQRVPLTPIQEAAAIAHWREKGQTDQEIAATLGQSVTFVVRRSKLLDLSPNWKEALREESSPYRAWSTAMLELVARYPHERQDSILDMNDEQYLPNLDELKNDLASDDNKLGNAPFSLTDENLLPKAGSCAVCPKRASAQPLLFSDEADSTVDIKKDSCIDPTCWKSKVAAHQAARFAAMKAEHPDAALVSTKQYYEIRDDKVPTGTLNASQYSQVGKKTEGAKPAILIDGKNAGQLIHIIESKHGSGARSVREKSAEPKKPLTDKERAQRLRDRRNAWIVNYVRESLLSGLPKGIMKVAIDHHALLALVATFGVSRHRDFKGGKFFYLNGFTDDWSTISKAREATLAGLAAAVWTDISRDLKRRLFAQNGEEASKLVKELAPMFQILGVTYEELWKLAAAEIPDKHNLLKENTETPSPAKAAKQKKAVAGKNKKAKKSR